MAYTSPKTYSVGDVLTASDMNTYQRDNISAIVTAQPLVIPFARVYNDANITISDDTITTLTFNSETFDTDTIHDTSTNTDRLTCKTAGIYLIDAQWKMTNSANGDRIIGIVLNGTTTIARSRIRAAAGGTSILSVSTIYSLAVNDYLQATAWQDSGGDENVEYDAEFSPVFGMAYLGKAST